MMKSRHHKATHQQRPSHKAHARVRTTPSRQISTSHRSKRLLLNNKSISSISMRTSKSSLSKTSNISPQYSQNTPRIFSTPFRSYTTPQSSNFYNTQSSKVFNHITHILSELESREDIDYSDTADVLTIEFHDGRQTWVLNKHQVTMQLWLSSPYSGPARFNYHPPNWDSSMDNIAEDAKQIVGGRWRHDRDSNIFLSDLLENEMNKSLNEDIIHFHQAF